MARTRQPPVPSIPGPQSTQPHPPTSITGTLSSHRATLFHETETPMTNDNDKTASRCDGWGRSVSSSYSLHHQQQRLDGSMTTTAASTARRQHREREMDQPIAPSVRHSGHDSSSRSYNDRRHDQPDNRYRGRETSIRSNNRHYTQYSSRDSRSYHYQRDYNRERHHGEYSSRNFRSYDDRNDYRDRGTHSSSNVSQSSRDRNSRHYSQSRRDRNSNHRHDADSRRRDDDRSHNYTSRDRGAEYVPRDDRHNSSRERDSKARQDSQRTHHSNNCHDSDHDAKRPRTDQTSSIDHLKIVRDAYLLEAQTSEAKLRKARAEREIWEQNLKSEEAKKKLEIVRVQPLVADRNERASIGVSAGGGSSVPMMSAVAGVAARINGLDTAVSGGTNLTVPSVAAATTPSSFAKETSDSDASYSTGNDPPFIPESFDVENSSGDLMVSVSPSWPKADGSTTKSTISKKKQKSPLKKKRGQKPQKSSAAKKKSNIEAEKRPISIYTENDMMSTYTPTIVDHCLVTKKFLIHWNTNDELFDTPCTSWMSFENFLFSDLAYKYIDKKVKDEGAMELAAYKNKFPGVIDLSEFDEEESDLLELDFCCFVCKCRDKGDTRSARNCLHARKYHRLCCHGLQVTDDLEDFACSAGQALMDALGPPQDDDDSDLENEGGELEMSRNEGSDGRSEAKCSAVTINSLLSSRERQIHPIDEAVVLCINTGIGGVAIALKQCSFKTKRMIHVEDDLVTQHTIRFHHDSKYGITEIDDGIEHIVGLYNTLDELRANPKDLVRRFGPIHLIICASSGKTKQEHEIFADIFLNFCDNVKRFNQDIYQHNSLFFMMETLPTDHLDLNKYSYCTCDSRVDNDPKRTFICNWPLTNAISTLRGMGSSIEVAELETALGFPSQYASRSVAALFRVLKTALTVGFVQKKWSDEVHPKYWGFLGLGPSGYTWKVNRNSDADSPLDMLLLLIKDSVSSKYLCDADYAERIVKGSISVRWLLGMLQPLADYFAKNQYAGVDSPAELTTHDGTETVINSEPVTFNQGSQEYTGVEADLCVVCEDAKKNIMILPCKHMCLCEKCADFSVIKDCPMCRTKVENSFVVYW